MWVDFSFLHRPKKREKRERERKREIRARERELYTIWTDSSVQGFATWNFCVFLISTSIVFLLFNFIVHLNCDIIDRKSHFLCVIVAFHPLHRGFHEKNIIGSQNQHFHLSSFSFLSVFLPRFSFRSALFLQAFACVKAECISSRKAFTCTEFFTFSFSQNFFPTTMKTPS